MEKRKYYKGKLAEKKSFFPFKDMPGSIYRLFNAKSSSERKAVPEGVGLAFPFKKLDKSKGKAKEETAPIVEAEVEETEEEKERKRKAGRAKTLMSSGDSGMATVGRKVLLGG